VPARINRDYLHLLILNDGDEIKNLLPKDDDSIIYHKLENKLPMGAKRQYMNNLAVWEGADVIVCMDDDDYYFDNYVRSCLDCLKNYEFCSCVKVNAYNVVNDKYTYAIFPFVGCQNACMGLYMRFFIKS
jgi:hypothetical protein